MPDDHNLAATNPVRKADARLGEIARAVPAAQPRAPLITAVEIENFKGIGRSIRIELRPITLLFGRNSAGKSSILHALCYAHEILQRENIDARKTEIGGEQIDLGGFRRFVHAHDLTRSLRLRFDLNLRGHETPGALWESIVSSLEHRQPEKTERLREKHGQLTSGWVALRVAAGNPVPSLASYEVGVNGVLVGRILSGTGNRRAVDVNLAHPLLNPSLFAAPSLNHGPSAPQAPPADGWRLRTVTVRHAASTLPNWEQALEVQNLGLEEYAVEKDELGAVLSLLLVGVGCELRDELARLRYVGPLRALRVETDVDPEVAEHARWSDGSAAWHLLRSGHTEPGTLSAMMAEHRRDVAPLIETVNEWLARTERLDTGYRLRRRSVVEVDTGAPLVTAIRRAYPVWRDTEVRIRKRLGWLANLERGLSHADLDALDDVRKGVASPRLEHLIRAIAEAPVRSTLQLLTVGSDLPVRTTDVGMGVSQLLPIVVAALDPSRPELTAIEQPELHVHPGIQVELGDLFAEQLDHMGNFLIETHSEHLLLRLLRRIEETNSGELPEGRPPVKPDQVSVVFIEQVDGEVRATPLRISESGEFVDRWPHGFFEERDDELF